MIDRLQRKLRRTFTGLWLSADFRRMWLSLTITSFGAQVTNLALPLTAAILLHSSRSRRSRSRSSRSRRAC